MGTNTPRDLDDCAALRTALERTGGTFDMRIAEFKREDTLNTSVTFQTETPADADRLYRFCYAENGRRFLALDDAMLMRIIGALRSSVSNASVSNFLWALNNAK